MNWGMEWRGDGWLNVVIYELAKFKHHIRHRNYLISELATIISLHEEFYEDFIRSQRRGQYGRSAEAHVSEPLNGQPELYFVSEAPCTTSPISSIAY